MKNPIKQIVGIIGCLFFLGYLSGCSRQVSSISAQASEPCHDVPLINAASDHNAYPQAQALLAHGANVNAVNRCGQTALSVAAEMNNVDMVDLFLSHGAKTDVRKSSVDNPLVMAASNGNTASASLLLAHGADVDGKQGSYTPLIAAVETHIQRVPEPRVNTAQELFDRVNKPEELLDMDKLLIAHGTNVNATCGGKTVLMIARQRHFVRTVALLKQAGAKR